MFLPALGFIDLAWAYAETGFRENEARYEVARSSRKIPYGGVGMKIRLLASGVGPLNPLQGFTTLAR